MFKTLITTVLFTLLSVQTVQGQYWVQPAKAPNVDVKCINCPGKANNQLTPGYPAALGTYLGRFLDSSATNDFQQPVRTMRAIGALPMLFLNRLYMQIGSSVMSWDLDSFLARVAAGEPLQQGEGSSGRPVPDIVLPFDSWYYAELLPTNTDDAGRKISSSGWDISAGGDGQSRLSGFDVDDQGYVYLATKWYRWGIVRDDLRRFGNLMSFVSQPGPFNDDVIPITIVSLRASNGSYYAVISDTIGPTLNVFDVTNRAAPQKRSNLSKSLYRYAKSSDGRHLGVVTVDGRLELYSTDTFISGGTPLFTRSDDAMVQTVASDGVNFYSAAVKSGNLLISTYVPDNNGYHKVADFTPTARNTISIENLRWGGNYLVATGLIDGSYELRLFKAPTPDNVTEVDLSLPSMPGFHGYFPKNFYKENTTGREGYVGAGLFGQFHDSVVVTRPTGTYLIVTAYGLGHVYQLDGIPGPQLPPGPVTVPGPGPVLPPTLPPPTLPLPPPQCPSMKNLFIFYSGVNTCSYLNSTGTCGIGENITFNVGTFGYDLGCATHTIRWNFGDGSGATFQTPPIPAPITHSYTKAGEFPVTLTVSSLFETATRQITIKVGSGTTITPPTPPPGPGPVIPPPTTTPECPPITPCPTFPPCPPLLPTCTCPTTTIPCTLVAACITTTLLPPQPPPVFIDNSCTKNTSIFYTGAGDCTSAGSGGSCKTFNNVIFTVDNYPWADCTNPVMTWIFGDGSTPQEGTLVQHTFTQAGRYNIQLTITVKGTTTVLTKTVVVE